MKETGESYSTAARNIANAPLSTGWLSLDSALNGGIRKGALYIFGSSLDNHQDLNDELLLNLTLPNSQVAHISNRTEEEIVSSLTRIYLANNFATASDSATGNLRPTNREQFRAHLKKNLLVSTIEPGAHPMQEIEALKRILDTNPKISAVYSDTTAERSAIDVEAAANAQRELQDIAISNDLPVLVSSRYAEQHSPEELRDYKMTRVGTLTHQAYAAVYFTVEDNGPVFNIWKNRGGACSEGLLQNLRQRISLQLSPKAPEHS